MKKTIKDFMISSEICQKNKYQAISLAGLLQPLSTLNRVWNDISMNFIAGLLVQKSDSYIAKKVANVFGGEIVRLHRHPKSIVSNKDCLFMSWFWAKLFHLVGTTLKFSSVYHPQLDDQTKVVNRGLKIYLHYFCVQQL